MAVDSRRPPAVPSPAEAAVDHPNDHTLHSVALEVHKEEGAVEGDSLEVTIDEISHVGETIDGRLGEGYYGDDRVVMQPPFLDDYSHYAAANGIHSAAPGHHIDDSPSPAVAHSAAAQDSPAAT